MENKYSNFGEFLQKKREEKKVTLRKMADMLGFSAPFLSDVEKDRRNPPEKDKLDMIVNILGLSEEEKDLMFNLAGRRRNTVAPDWPEYIMERDYVSSALRTARDLNARGIPSVAVFSDASGEYTEKRNVAIQKLKNGEIKVIFSVDMFNEGVDITSVDMVMFLRPTESPIVFLQQLGRGPRKYRGKEFLTVLDFIGNYEKAGRVRFLLEGKTDVQRKGVHLSDALQFPDDCLVDFDMKLIDLFAEMDRKHLKLKDQIINEYFKVKELLAKRPTRLDLFTYMDDNIYEVAITHSKDNPFKRYLEFLNDLGELSQIEKEFYKGIGREFISLIENTNMSKVYKMPVFMAFYNNSNVLMEVTEKQLLSSWKKFFSTGTNWKDLDKNMTLQKYKDISDMEHLRKILAMPVHFLLESGKGFFIKDDDVILGLREELRPLIDNPVMIQQMKDVIDYRTMDYYKRRYREKQN